MKSFASLIGKTRQRFAGLTDTRGGKNIRYSMEDFATSAFGVFFTQSPSFLAHQKAMQQNKGRSNAQSLFQIEEIPCDNQIRDCLDPVAPQEIFPLYDETLQALQEQGVLETYRAIARTIAIALDGTWYYSSEKIHCPHCSCIEHSSGQKTYYHSAITPVIVAPGKSRAIPLRPEFIVPQDGHDKQDCETAAGKRWIEQNSARYAPLKATLLGDDIYAHQPMCRRALLHNFHFIFVCKPESHIALYKWVNLLQPQSGLHTLKEHVKNAKGHWETHTYRWANGVPLAEGDDALKVNWCEVTITKGKGTKGEMVYHNAFISDFEIHRSQRRASGCYRPGPLEGRERKQQRSQKPRLPPRTQLWPRPKTSFLAFGGDEHPGVPLPRLPGLLRRELPSHPRGSADAANVLR